MNNAVIFKVRDSGEIFEAYEIDHVSKKIGGYKIFNGYGESNPFRVLKMDKVEVYHVKNTEPEEKTIIYN